MGRMSTTGSERLMMRRSALSPNVSRNTGIQTAAAEGSASEMALGLGRGPNVAHVAPQAAAAPINALLCPFEFQRRHSKLGVTYACRQTAA